MKLEKSNEMQIIERRGKMNTKMIGFAAAVTILTLAAVLATSDTAQAYYCWYEYFCNYWGCGYVPRCVW
jgi:hypothetical protein